MLVVRSRKVGKQNCQNVLRHVRTGRNKEPSKQGIAYKPEAWHDFACSKMFTVHFEDISQVSFLYTQMASPLTAPVGCASHPVMAKFKGQN